MPIFRKRPVDVEAFQWHGEEVEGFERICVGKDELSNDCYNLVIPTLNGPVYAVEGEWIVKGIEGEFYPCRDDIFKKTYIEVGQED